MKKSFRKNYFMKKAIFLISIVVFLDQISKFFILKYFQSNKFLETKINSFFNLIFSIKKGIAFGFLPFSQNILTIVIAIILIILIFFVLRSKTSFYLCVVAGGGLGNFIDRIFRGFVIDFLDFHMFGYHFPAFNIADSAISIGVLLHFIKNKN